MTKSSKGVEGYTHLHQRNWCNLKWSVHRLKVQITENPNLCNTFSVFFFWLLLLLSLADLYSWQPSRRDTASFYVCVILNSLSSMLSWWVCQSLHEYFEYLMCHMLFVCLNALTRVFPALVCIFVLYLTFYIFTDPHSSPLLCSG